MKTWWVSKAAQFHFYYVAQSIDPVVTCPNKRLLKSTQRVPAEEALCGSPSKFTTHVLLKASYSLTVLQTVPYPFAECRGSFSRGSLHGSSVADIITLAHLTFPICKMANIETCLVLACRMIYLVSILPRHWKSKGHAKDKAGGLANFDSCESGI